ncbi:MAG: hypothetical protein ABIK09_19250 [Pseudomonadota bacterium]
MKSKIALAAVALALSAMCCAGGTQPLPTAGPDTTEDGRTTTDAAPDTPCVPACGGRECGDDGCGGTCGDCDDDLFCTDDSCGGGTCVFAVQEFYCVINATCAASGTEQPGNGCQKCLPLISQVGWSAVEDGVPCGAGKVCFQGACCDAAANCAGKVCGDDDCGGTCGECSTGFECQGGLCVELCFPDCEGKECGDDSCGGSCGGCGEGETCQGGQCICPGAPCGELCCPWGSVCTDGVCCFPSCLLKECGDNGCDGSCGECPPWSQCTAQSKCLTICDLICEDRECGPDGCGGSCGFCDDGLTCTDDGICVEACTPDCTGKQCGPNGCGGICGTCSEALYCVEGQCQGECVPDCFLKGCGDDGCEGSCGECPEGVLCTSSGFCGGFCTQCTYAPHCADLDFSAGTMGAWAIEAAQVLPVFGSTQALTGGFMVKLTTGEGLTSLGSHAFFQTCLSPGDYGVEVMWRVYSEEFKEWCGSSFQDEFHAWIGVGEQTVDLVHVAIDDLCPPEECLNCGSSYAGLEQSEVDLDVGGVWKTPWIVTWGAMSVTESGQILDLHLEATDVGSSIYDTVVLVDRVRFVPCSDACDDLECGPGPCGADCGDCADGGLCLAGHCCHPDCGGKECGPDGCDGTCGTCEQGVCIDGLCCYPDCAGKECGSDGCGGSCGSCTEPDNCEEGSCLCHPDCDGKECGSDGCGGTCGSCDDGDTCTTDSCKDHVCDYVNTCCSSDEECNDFDDVCTVDSCVSGFCEYQPSGVEGCCVPTYFRDDFSTDLGWTYGQNWQRGLATASSGGTYNPDPTDDHSSSDDNFIAGVVIGGNAPTSLGGFYWITSPVIDTSAVTSPHLSLWRWLNSDYTPYMQNKVEAFNGISWTLIWQSGGSPGIADAAWTHMDLDVTAQKSASFRIRIGYNVGSSGAYTISQWNVDDVIVYEHSQVTVAPMCCGATSDCLGIYAGAPTCSGGQCD